MSISTRLSFITALLLLVLSAGAVQAQEAATMNSEDFVARFGFQASPTSGLKVVTAFAAACHSTTPCGSAYGACANWSSFSDCGDQFCGAALGCGECDEWGHCEAYGPALKQLRERYRVCFNQLGQSCTEYQLAASTGGCGC
ncbi:MAG: hypothetical protein QOH06_5168 [Acidobacteriota bacterium]|jgi:hypothetical protein|nr:hypothetical protein [Acidobacteriota bacterium]